MSLNFKNFYTFEKYQKLVDLEKEEKSKEKPNYDSIFKERENFEDAIISYLKERSKLGLLKEPENLGNHYSNLLVAWSNLVNGKLTHFDEDKIKNTFERLIEPSVMSIIYSKEEVNINDKYEELIKKINDGNFLPTDLQSDSECFDCAQRIKLCAKDWNFKIATLKLNENKKYEYKLIDDCIEEKLYEVKVNFSTGELLIADWFRIKEFTEQVEYNKDYKDVSINASLGQIKSTQHAANLGFVTVHVGNSCPTIFEKDGNFVFGREKEEGDVISYTDKGTVCTDLWNVTIIDKQKLIEIVALKLGEEKAMEIVEEYIAENDMHKFSVTPGEYTIGFYPRSNINKFDKEIPTEIETLFSMKKHLPHKKLKM